MMRRVVIFLLVLAALLLFSLLVLYFGMKTEGGQHLLVKTLDRLAPDVHLEGLSGDLPADLSVARLTLTDRQGIWLEIDQLHLAWHPFEALRGHYQIDRLEAGRVALLRLPVSDNKPKSSGTPSLPDLSQDRLGQLEIGRIELPASLTGGTPQVLTLNGQLTEQGDQNRLRLALKTLEGPSTVFDLEATLAQTIDGALRIDEAPAGLIGHLLYLDPAHPLTAEVTLAGTPDQWQAKAQLHEAAAPLLDLEALSKPVEEGSHYEIRWTGRMPGGLAKAVPSLSPLGQTHRGEAVFTIDPENNIDISNAALMLDGLTLDAHGRYSGDDGPVALDLTADAGSLAPFSLLAGENLRGPLAAHLEIKGRMEALAASLDLSSKKIGVASFDLDDLAVRLHAIIDAEQWRLRGRGPLASDGEIELRYLGKPAKLIYGASLEQDNTLAVKRLSVESAYGMLSGEGNFRLSGGTVDGTLTAERLALGPLLPDLDIDGTARIAATFSGTAADMAVGLEASAEKLRGLPGGFDALTGGQAVLSATTHWRPASEAVLDTATLEAGALHAEANGRYGLADQALAATLTGRLRQKGYAPLDLALDAAKTRDRLDIRNLNAKAPGMALSGKFAIDLTDTLADGNATLAATDLSALSPLLGERVSGRAQAALVLKRQDGHQAATLNGHAEGIAAGDVSLGAADITASLTDAFNLVGIKAALKARDFRSGGLLLNTLALDAHSLGGRNNTTPAVAITASANGHSAGAPLALKLGGSLNRQKETKTVSLASLDGNYGGQPLSLKKPATLRLTGDDWQLSPLALRYGSGSVLLQGVAKRGIADITAEIAALPLAALMPANPNAPAGNLSAHLAVAGPVRTPNATLHADLSAASPGQGLPPATLHADATVKGGSANVKADLKMENGNGTASLRLPVHFSLSPFAFEAAPSAPLSGSAQLALPLSSVNPWLRPTGQQVGGALNGKLNFGGTLGSPDVKGQLQLADGRYDSIDSGVCLRHLDASLDGSEEHLRLSRLAAHDENGGSLSGSGDITLSGAGTIDLKTRLDSLRLFCRGPAVGVLSGDLAASGSFADLLLKGDMRLGPLTINLPGGPGSEIPEVKVTRLGAPVKRQDEGGAGHTVRLDIAAAAPDRVFVRGRGLNAEFKGTLRVAGTAARPDVTGTLETVRGSFDLLDRPLTLSTARITFGGPIPPSPFLDITATSTVNGTTITVALNGSATKPALTLTSTPVLPQDEILAQLLFGRDLKSISPFQAIQLAQSAATLAGKGGGGPGLLDKARDALGVDTLTVDQGNNNTTTVGAGKYINDRVYVGVEQGATPESRAVKTEIEVTPSITAGASTGSEGQTGVNLGWRWDY